MWQPAAVIVQQEYWRHKLVTVRPLTVVEDSATLLALYAPTGAPFRYAPWSAPSRRQVSLNERLQTYLNDAQPELVDGMTRGPVLTLNVPGAWHSFKLFWDSDWRFRYWQVNLEAPYERGAGGIIHRDLFLDIVVAPNLTWEWKDVDEFAALRAAGAITAAIAEQIQAEAERLVARIEARAWPFDSDWPEWRPDHRWPPPARPDGWQPPHGYEA